MRAIIFDLDGVVADTAPAHYRSWKALADEEGIAFSPDDYRRLLGRTREDSLRLFAGEQVKSEGQFEDWLTRKQSHFVAELAQLTPDDILPGVSALIDAAKDQAMAVGLASSSRNARAVLDRLGLADSFTVIADGNASVAPKPAPDIFLIVADALGAAPGETLVIEDSEAGLQGARSGGFLVVTVGTDRLSAAHRASLDGATPLELFDLALESLCPA